MKNEVLNEIKEFAIKKLNQHYGYCGVAEADNIVKINADDKKGNDIKIVIEIMAE